MLPSVKGVDSAKAQGQAIINTAVNALIEYVKFGNQYIAAIEAINKTPPVKYLLTLLANAVMFAS